MSWRSAFPSSPWRPRSWSGGLLVEGPARIGGDDRGSDTLTPPPRATWMLPLPENEQRIGWARTGHGAPEGREARLARSIARRVCPDATARVGRPTISPSDSGGQRLRGWSVPTFSRVLPTKAAACRFRWSPARHPPTPPDRDEGFAGFPVCSRSWATSLNAKALGQGDVTLGQCRLHDGLRPRRLLLNVIQERPKVMRLS